MSKRHSDEREAPPKPKDTSQIDTSKWQLPVFPALGPFLDCPKRLKEGKGHKGDDTAEAAQLLPSPSVLP